MNSALLRGAVSVSARAIFYLLRRLEELRAFKPRGLWPKTGPLDVAF
jgi:hypothetical protein